MDDTMEIGARRVRELLDAHMAQAQSEVTERIAGKVAVTVDARLRLTAVRILDESLDERTRRELEQAFVEAANGAQRRAVLAAAEAVSRLKESTDWRAAMEKMFKQGQ